MIGIADINCKFPVMATMKWSQELVSEEGLKCTADINCKFPVMATKGLISEEGLIICIAEINRKLPVMAAIKWP
jgi:hypothetical protein